MDSTIRFLNEIDLLITNIKNKILAWALRYGCFKNDRLTGWLVCIFKQQIKNSV